MGISVLCDIYYFIFQNNNKEKQQEGWDKLNQIYQRIIWSYNYTSKTNRK